MYKIAAIVLFVAIFALGNLEPFQVKVNVDGFNELDIQYFINNDQTYDVKVFWAPYKNDEDWTEIQTVEGDLDNVKGNEFSLIHWRSAPDGTFNLRLNAKSDEQELNRTGNFVFILLKAKLLLLWSMMMNRKFM